MASPHFASARYLLNYFEVLGKQFYTKNVSGSSSCKERKKEREREGETLQASFGMEVVEGIGKGKRGCVDVSHKCY